MVLTAILADKATNIMNVELLLGVEFNIMNPQGAVDMEDALLKKMDITIASMHVPCFKSGSREENTNTYHEH